MAYVYPEDRIDDGVVTDPRPLNRTLGHYYGEFNGMLDKDNFYRYIIDTTRIVNFSGSQAAATSGMAGPCNQIKSWRSTANQIISGNGTTGFATLDNIGGNINTQDSGMIVEASVTYSWSTVAVADMEDDMVEFLLTVDGLEVDSTGGLSLSWYYNSVYLNGYAPVSAGGHTVSLYFRVYNSHWNYTDHCSYIFPANGTITFTNRELIVREVRR